MPDNLRRPRSGRDAKPRGTPGRVPLALRRSFVLLLRHLGWTGLVAIATNTPGLSRFTGLFGEMLLLFCIAFEAPRSGMSINPARTVASALPSGNWTAAWIYFIAPVGSMLLVAGLYRRP